MIKGILTSLLLAVAIPTSAEINGAWSAVGENDGKLDLRVTIRQWNQFNATIDPETVPGLSAAVRGTTTTPVQFQLKREAGTISFEGIFKNGDGGGQFTFVENPRFLAAIRATGIEMDLVGDRSEDEVLLSLALIDLTADYIRSMQTVFPEISLREARRALGVRVTPQYVKSLRDAGVNITTAREAARLAGVNVTPQYVAELAAAGYKNLSVRDLTRLAGNGVDARFIREASRYGRNR